MKKSIVFIDGSNLYGSTRKLGFEMDYAKLLDYFRKTEEEKFLRMLYYTAIPERDNSTVHKIIPLIDYLQYNGYCVRTKLIKEFEEYGRTKIKGNMDVELTIDALKLAPFMDTMHLFSGDGDFTSLVREIQSQGVMVVVYSASDLLADELRRQADVYVDLVKIRQYVMRSG